MQPRRIARELTLLSISQLPTDPTKLQNQNIQDLLLSSVRTLAEEARDTLERAVSELKQGNKRLLASELTAQNVRAAHEEVTKAILLTQKAINHVGTSLEIPEFVQLADDRQVRAYALELIGVLARERERADLLLGECIEGWQVERLTRIDRNILRLAVAEIVLLKSVPYRVAIDEAVELAKKYSDETGARFINGVLRRVVKHLQLEQTPRA
ncbi:MAG: transcription antitermination protein NusB [Gemmatimonadaceae bacterium]|nr:transcription antitermination protein NusB [Gloeobacterales cyanobacterium ES-bin-141]